MAKKLKYTVCKTTDEVKAKYPKLVEDVVKIPLMARVGKKEINSGMFGVYSPSAKAILVDCKGNTKLTTNFDFVTEVENYVNQLGFEVGDMYSLSQGGKMYADFDITSKINVPKELSALNVRVNAFVIETNDTSFKMRVGAEVFLSENSSVIIQDTELESEYRNLRSFVGTRSSEIVDLTLKTIEKVNLFMKKLVALKAINLTSDKLDEFLRTEFSKKGAVMASRTMYIFDTITENVRIESAKVGMNYLALVIGVGQHLHAKYEDGDAREVFLFRNGKIKNDNVLKSMDEVLKQNNVKINS